MSELLSAEERAKLWGAVREVFDYTMFGATLQALCADHEALAAQANCYNGQIAYLRTWDSARTAQEVLDSYNADPDKSASELRRDALRECRCAPCEWFEKRGCPRADAEAVAASTPASEDTREAWEEALGALASCGHQCSFCSAISASCTAHERINTLRSTIESLEA